MIGLTAQFKDKARIAIAGAECDLELNDAPANHGVALQVPAGAILKVGRLRNGARAYLAVRGGVDEPLVMGSASTYVAAGFGGWQGRLLRKGDVLRVREGGGLFARSHRPGKLPSINLGDETLLRVTRSAQQGWFGTDAFAVLFSNPFEITEQSGRSGLRLKGQRITPHHTSSMLTDGVPLGAIQIPPDGQPIILFVDQQTTGGYPKIASVIAADLPKVGQLRPRDRVRFSEVSIDEAIHLLREQELLLNQAFEEC
jgi:antagonist of KipI